MMIDDKAIVFVFACVLILVGVILALFGVTPIAWVVLGVGVALLLWLAMADSGDRRL